MRPLLACLVLLVAGCAQAPAPPGPRGPTPEPEPDFGPEVRDGPWTLRVAPRLLQGEPGEPIRFTVEVRHDGLPPPGSVLEPSSFFAWLDDAPSRSIPLTEQTTRTTGRILAGADDYLQLQVLVHGGGVNYHYLRGGALLGGANATVLPLDTEIRPGAGSYGLNARQEEGRRVNVTFSLRDEGGVCTKPLPASDFILFRREGRQEVWGFVKEQVDHSPDCRARNLHHQAVRAMTPTLAPGEVVARVYSVGWCQCEPKLAETRIVVD